MNYRVLLSQRADQDRQQAFEWYAANFSPGFARRWFAGITNAIDSLALHPDRHPKAAEDAEVAFDVFELLYGSKKNKHRILYTVERDQVVVLFIHHSARRHLTADDFANE